MIEIRKAKPSDMESLSVLFDKYRVFYEKDSDLNGAKNFLSERLAKNESTIFMAFDETKGVGFVQLYPIFSSTKMQRLWLLNDLFVNETCRGKGVSKLLIEASKNHCTETDACGLVLETAKTNEIGINLYPSAGFKLDEEHNYYAWDV